MRSFNITAETYQYKFDPETYQQSDLFQYYHWKYAVWFNLKKYYDSKKDYYKTGTSKLTDQEFDALEGTIEAIGGKGTLKKYGCVGYDHNKHLMAKLCFNFFDDEIKRRFTIPWNNHARKCQEEREKKRQAEVTKILEHPKLEVYDKDNPKPKPKAKPRPIEIKEEILPNPNQIEFDLNEFGQLGFGF